MGAEGMEADADTEITNEADLMGPGAAVGTIPTDLDQATGLERLEILGKVQGVDIFDMKPLDASRLGMFNIRPQFGGGDAGIVKGNADGFRRHAR